MDKTIDHRLAWLAGIIDGEGWIGFGVNPPYGRGHKNHAARWNVEVQNTDAAMLVEVMAIADILGVPSKYQTLKLRFNARKPQARVAFKSRAACRIVVSAVLPYLITKRPQAELMLRALAQRPIEGQRPDRAAGWIAAQNDTEFLRMAEEIRIMNRRGTAPVEG